jgi:hypothetical protein
MPETDQDQEKPFEQRFGDLCSEYARAMEESIGTSNDEHTQIHNKQRELRGNLYEMALVEVIKTSADDREKLMVDMIGTMNRKTVVGTRNYSFADINFMMDVLLAALEKTESKLKHSS